MDNVSTLYQIMKENDADSWTPVQNLLQLRRASPAAVLSASQWIISPARAREPTNLFVLALASTLMLRATERTHVR